MDRHTTAQLVAIVVVLFVLLRWVPSDAPRHPLGMGQPLNTVRFDRRVAQIDARDRDAAVALLRFGVRPGQEHGAQYFKGMLEEARRMLRDPPDDLFVQFGGVFRNDLWWLMYRFYPVPCSTFTLEEGSRIDKDARLPGATLFPVGYTEAGYAAYLAGRTADQLERRRRGQADDDDVREEGR